VTVTGLASTPRLDGFAKSATTIVRKPTV
jgi:hypothetical protein